MIDKLVVCDAGPLIALAKINQLHLLSHLFKEIFIPDIVRDECLYHDVLPGAKAIKAAISNGFIYVKSPQLNASLERVMTILDPGEKAAICLAHELKAILLIDEKRGRSVAHNLSLDIIGTAGLLLKSYQAGHLLHLKECLRDLQKSGYRLSDRLVEEILSRMNPQKPVT